MTLNDPRGPTPRDGTSPLLRKVQEVFRPLYGTPCWNARHGHGSFITFEFGQPHLHVREPSEPDPSRSPAVQRMLRRRTVFVHGEWHLWIYQLHW